VVSDYYVPSGQPSGVELDAALVATGYRFSDPCQDPGFPRVTEHDGPDSAYDTFRPGWGSEPTERDQAAIDAGNAGRSL
jgi:hypothetical protein